MTKPYIVSQNDVLEQLWPRMHVESTEIIARDPALASFVHAMVLERSSFPDALGYLLADELASRHMEALQLFEVINEAYRTDSSIVTAAKYDLAAILERDPAALSAINPFLFFKGFHALQAYRVGQWLWQTGRKTFALYLQSRIAKNYSVDIHPAARIGHGIMMDHANGIVIGETSVVEDNVSFLHSVTLGGTGKEHGDRHPKIRKNVMIGAGAKILGNIEVGVSSKVAAGSVVLEDVPPCTVVAGVPARIVGKAGCENAYQLMDQTLPPTEKL